MKAVRGQKHLKNHQGVDWLEIFLIKVAQQPKKPSGSNQIWATTSDKKDIFQQPSRSQHKSNYISDKIKPFSEYSTLELKSRDNGYWYWNVWVHNEDDLLDALTIHPSFTNLIPAHSYAISLRTKHFVRSSTMSTPCSKHRQRTCKDHFVKKAIANQYGCQVCIKFLKLLRTQFTAER